MKKIFIILIAFIIGASASSVYAQTQRLIQVPEYIGGYSTVELLNYVANMKAKEEVKIKVETKAPQIIKKDKKGNFSA